MQLLHRRFELAAGKQFDDAFASVDRLVDQRLFVAARRVENEVGDGMFDLKRARVPDADAQSPEIGGREPGLGVLQSIVAGRAAPALQLDGSRR